MGRKNNDNLTELTIEGYIRVWLTEGAFSGILSIVQKFVAGSLVDKNLFDAVIHFFRLLNGYHDTRIIYVAHKYLGDNNLFVLIADFFRHEFAQDPTWSRTEYKIDNYPHTNSSRPAIASDEKY